ncbi:MULTISPECIES: transporter substrate-binding domain-containing protein [Paracoccus]|uniref:transporter substrate-binding domain-containing protein n=2 Tax=Paracoccus TaxID=265 RepID=UPI0004661C25|nr:MULTISPECIES: transporter substrate-binding domain-containing protein [Paracoccus]RDD70166.1 amino acid ABC transporter [Paracoccus versutus]MBT0782381.1 transporter substrate-binding domain-containing protein [Paracoccus sp. pheM1]RDD93172.1 amino acid ABC transporter [Paracoccus pantotrophus]WGR66214.1 transporter substrate-binding domain-containing protein [Paracoccus pantotrophus]SFP14543.1 polar amino acid transport system substrate-binding protein [Paracoccus pantotrophus]
MKRRMFLIAGAAASCLPYARAFAADNDTLSQVKASGKLRIGVTSAEPWFFKDPMTEKWTGVGIAMGERMAQELGVEMVPVETSWANAVAGLQANQFDIMFVLDPTEERRNAVDFPDQPLFYYAMGALVPEDSAVASWADLDTPETKLGVTLGTSLDRNVTEMMKSAAINRFSSNDEAIAAFAAGRVDAVVQFHPALVVQYSRLKMGKVVLPTPVDPVATSAGMRKASDDSFRTWVGETFAKFYEEGVPDQIFSAYLESKNIDPTGIPGLVKESW